MDLEFATRGPAVTQSTIQQLMYVLPGVSPDLSLIGKTAAVTSILENSKVIITMAMAPTVPPPLLTRGPVGAIVNHVAAQCQDQGRLLEEANRDLEVFKKSYYRAERDLHDHLARFNQEKQVLNDEIHQLKVRFFPT